MLQTTRATADGDDYNCPMALQEEELGLAAETINADASALEEKESDYDPLLDAISERNIVLLGEGSHGTHEFYQERAKISQRLIEEKGFRAIAIEGDWPDVSYINRYIQTGLGNSSEALSQFKRFPLWMWRNQEWLSFIEWLKDFNQGREDKVAVYGLDLYGLYPAINEIISYLESVDPNAAETARRQYACFGTEGGEDYGRSVHLGVGERCRRQAVSQLVALRRSWQDDEEHFIAEGNAELIIDAEEYYRAIFQDPSGSWNIRERHMADTFDHLLAHLDRRLGKSGKIIVWAHNSHVSDARATSAIARGDLTLGQILRERHDRDVFSVGFTTFSGTVTAARDWGEKGEVYQVEPGHFDSIERLFHESTHGNFLLIQKLDNKSSNYLQETFSQRAIGVVYRPQTERQSHYLSVIPALEFDAFIHIDQTSAIESLDILRAWAGREAPDTYPSAV